MKKWKVVTLICLSLLMALFIDWIILGNTFSSNISNEAWVRFLGSYILSMATVFITIHDNNKKMEQQRIIQENQENEQRRLSIRSYLDTRYTYLY